MCVVFFFSCSGGLKLNRQADFAAICNVKRPLTFCSLCSRVASRHRGVLEKQRRPATNTAEVKGQMCISACVSKIKRRKRTFRQASGSRRESKRKRKYYGSFVFTSVLTVTSPQKCINNKKRKKNLL